ncbi:DUF975 family protein [Bacteroidales bacterium OttesenSCG-928-K03]|nr:DUF975 family protein [Odoribacter sp. OttesenSCG-928-L07]MDL2240154.1 DUF975 family protein [Bacteroidales bacterium OttesenSCG-928-K22]MDL2242978.1 DUF975 family protein [Bacteroidales bacterium OttesenSCG-928-K03]
MTPNVILMQRAKDSLKGMWGTAAIVTLIYSLILNAISATIAGGLIVGGPLTLGYVFFIKSLKFDKENASIERVFDGFKDFSRSLIAYILIAVYVFLWMLLLIIPGIIMNYAYSMTYFILSEDKEISASDALKKSKQMMMGNKWKLFCLELRFFGWILLCILTLGIGFLWLQPYMEMARLNFYYDLKGVETDDVMIC